MYAGSSLRNYIEDLAAKKPAPGGGSAAALNAALGVSLISMVANFTTGKPKYAKYEAEINNILKKSDKLRNDFLSMVDLDVKAYQSRDPRKAMEVPFMLCRLCLEGVKLCLPLIKKGNTNLISDVAVAAIMLESAFACGYFNVAINLKFINDKSLAGKIRRELDAKQKTIKRIRKTTEEQVGKIIRG
jgi:formiminotetrahydrofolate cyclodeaminase